MALDEQKSLDQLRKEALPFPKGESANSFETYVAIAQEELDLMKSSSDNYAVRLSIVLDNVIKALKVLGQREGIAR